MGYVNYIGRVGALAVALGVGLAVASTPGFAHAQQSNSDASPAASDSTSAASTDDTCPDDTSPADDGAPTAEDTDSPAAEPQSPSDPSDPQPPADSDPNGDDDTADDLEKDVAQADDADVEESIGTDDDGETTHVPGASKQKDPVQDTDVADAPDFTPPADDDDTDQLVVDVVEPKSHSLDIGTIVEPPATLSVPVSAPVDLLTTMSTAAPTPVAELAAVVEQPSALPAAGLADLLEAVLGGFGPVSPLQSSLLLQVLAHVRDELEGIVNPTTGQASPQATAQLVAPQAAVAPVDLNVVEMAPPQVQLVRPKLVDPSTWLPFVGDVLYDTRVLVQRNINIYDFNTPQGWAAFILDYTWGLPGTILGYGIQIINFWWPDDPMYRDDLSYHQNRHVYEGGFYVKEGYAHTQGNTTTNMGFNGSGVSTNVLENHESLHIRQSRMFGPLYQGTYVVWAAGGVLVAAAYWLAHPDEDFASMVTTTAYIDNPFEYRAYKNAGNWPPQAAYEDLVLWP